MTALDLLNVVGDVAGLGVVVVFVILGYRVFVQSVTRAQDVDDKTIAALRKRLTESETRETALQDRLDKMDSRLDEMTEQFKACKEQLVAVQAYMKLNYGIDPDDITGAPI